jgi:hypothetical protein
MSQRVSQEFIFNYQGKDFVLFSGLLELAHQDGLKFIDTQILQFPTEENGQTCVIKATVETSKGRFTGHGDANPKNVGTQVVKHLLRMCETRAIARALRMATNVGLTAYDELGGDEKGSEEFKEELKKPATPKAQKQAELSDEDKAFLAGQQKIGTMIKGLLNLGMVEKTYQDIVDKYYKGDIEKASLSDLKKVGYDPLVELFQKLGKLLKTCQKAP